MSLLMQICLELAIASPASRVDPIFEAEHLSVLFVSSSLVAQRQFPSDTVLQILWCAPPRCAGYLSRSEQPNLQAALPSTPPTPPPPAPARGAGSPYRHRCGAPSRGGNV